MGKWERRRHWKCSFLGEEGATVYGVGKAYEGERYISYSLRTEIVLPKVTRRSVVKPRFSHRSYLVR